MTDTDQNSERDHEADAASRTATESDPLEPAGERDTDADTSADADQASERGSLKDTILASVVMAGSTVMGRGSSPNRRSCGLA